MFIVPKDKLQIGVQAGLCKWANAGVQLARCDHILVRLTLLRWFCSCRGGHLFAEPLRVPKKLRVLKLDVKINPRCDLCRRNLCRC